MYKISKKYKKPVGFLYFLGNSFLQADAKNHYFFDQLKHKKSIKNPLKFDKKEYKQG